MAYIIRSDKVWGKAKRNTVKRVCRNVYNVTSSTSGNVYQVNTSTKRCTCERDQYIGRRNNFVNACSHVQAATRAQYRLEFGKDITFRVTDFEAKKLHRQVIDFGGDGVVFTTRTATAQKLAATLPNTVDAMNDLLFG